MPAEPDHIHPDGESGIAVIAGQTWHRAIYDPSYTTRTEPCEGCGGPTCPDCGTPRHGVHRAGCATEPCPRCHGQAVNCPCNVEFLEPETANPLPHPKIRTARWTAANRYEIRAEHPDGGTAHITSIRPVTVLWQLLEWAGYEITHHSREEFPRADT